MSSTLDNSNELEINEPITNVVESIDNSSQTSMIQNNVTLTNYNNFKIVLDGVLDVAANDGDMRHTETVNKVNGHITGHMDGLSKQILDYTLITFAIMIIGILGFCAVRSYTKKPAPQSLIHIESTMQQLQTKIDNIQASIDELE